MVGEVALAQGEEALDVGLELIVYPKATHGIVDSREDHHRVVVRIHVGNLLVHVEEVAITLVYHVAAETVESLREVEEHGQASVVDAIALVGTLLGCA